MEGDLGLAKDVVAEVTVSMSAMTPMSPGQLVTYQMSLICGCFMMNLCIVRDVM